HPNGRPLVFCGIFNLNGTHYIPYFIHRPQQGPIQVICLDPSPQIRLWDAPLKPKEEPCPKLKTTQAVERLFQDLFPGCEVNDPNVTQQIRQRDCGPNSLSVLEDVLSSHATHFPVLTVENDRMHLHPLRLSVNFNSRRLFDYAQHHFMYAPETAIM